jgi:hypothetical protein
LALLFAHRVPTQTREGETLSVLIAVCERAMGANRTLEIVFLDSTFKLLPQKRAGIEHERPAGRAHPDLNYAAVQYYQREGEGQPLSAVNLNGQMHAEE